MASITESPSLAGEALSLSTTEAAAAGASKEGALSPDWEGFLRDAAELFEAEPDLASLDAALEADPDFPPQAAAGTRPAEGFRSLRARLFVEAKPGKSLPPGCALALLLAAQTSWIERGLAHLPLEEGAPQPGPAPFLRLNWTSAWPLSEAAFDATFGPRSAFADKALSWFFPADANAPRGVEPYRTAQFMRRAPEFWRMAQADHAARQERRDALSHLPAAGSVSFAEALRIAREERAAANMAPPAKGARFAFAEQPEPIGRPSPNAGRGPGGSANAGRAHASAAQPGSGSSSASGRGSGRLATQH